MSTLRQLLEDRYKIKLTDKEYSDLEFIMSIHNFSPINCRFDAYNDMPTLINNLHLCKNFHVNRDGIDVTDEEVIYSLYPIPIGETLDIHTTIPKMEKKKIERAVTKQFEPFFDHNITIIRTVNIKTELGEHMKVDEEFTFMLYSKKLNVHAGIIFESV